MFPWKWIDPQAQAALSELLEIDVVKAETTRASIRSTVNGQMRTKLSIWGRVVVDVVRVRKYESDTRCFVRDG